MSNWLKRDIQKAILEDLCQVYPSAKRIEDIAKSIAQSEGIVTTNIQYLMEHGLINMWDGTLDTGPHSKSTGSFPKLNAKGIDFLADDGGLSAILGVITVKLHSDSIQALIAAKIDQAEISDSEKGGLKKELGKIKDTALSTLTTNAINAIPADTLVKFLKSAIGL